MEHKQEQRLSKLKLSETLFALSQARVEACANALKNCQIMVVFKKFKGKPLPWKIKFKTSKEKPLSWYIASKI